MRQLSRVMSVLSMLTGVLFTWVYIFVKTHQTVHFEVFTFYCVELYLNIEEEKGVLRKTIN